MGSALGKIDVPTPAFTLVNTYQSSGLGRWCLVLLWTFIRALFRVVP
jgi:hypothetical protein